MFVILGIGVEINLVEEGFWRVEMCISKEVFVFVVFLELLFSLLIFDVVLVFLIEL